MSWIQAVQEYAKETGKFIIPKKDSDEYVKIKAIQERMKQPTPPAKTKKTKTPASVELPKAQPVQNVVVEKKPRKPRVKKEKEQDTTEKPKKKVERLLIVQQPVEMSFK